MNIGELLATLGLNTAKMQKDLNKANREFKKFSSKSTKEMNKVEKRWKRMSAGLGKIKSAIGGVVRAMGPLGAALGIGGLGILIGSSVKSFAAFEEQMSKIASLTPHVSRVMGEMSDSIKEVGIQYGIAREEIAKAGFDIVSAGAAGEDLAKTNEILAASAELAKAGFASMDVATSALITSLQIYGDQLGSARKAAEFFFNVQKFGRTDVEQLSSVFGRFASVAKALDVELNLLGATFATLTLQGLPIEQVATQLVGILSTFTRKQTPDAIKALKEVGFEMNSASLQGQGLLNVLEGLSSVSVTQLRAIFPEEQAFRGITFLLQAQDKLKSILKDVNKESKNAVGFQGALEGAMKLTTTKLNSLNEQWKRFKDLVGEKSVNTAAEGFGLLNSSIETTGGLIDWINDKLPLPLKFFAPIAQLKGAKEGLGIVIDALKGTEDAIEEVIPHWKTLSDVEADAEWGITTYSKATQDFKNKMDGVIDSLNEGAQAWQTMSDAQLAAELGGDGEVGILQIEAEAKAKQKALAEEITANAKFAGQKADMLAQEKIAQNEIRRTVIESDREMRMILVRQLDASRKAREQQIDGTKNQFDMMEQFAIQGARGMQSAMQEFFFDVFNGEIKSSGELLNSLWRMAANILANVASEAVGSAITKQLNIGGAAKTIPNIGRVTQTGSGQFILGKIPTKQHGGPITGPAIVGEDGPELFMPKSSGTIIPNDKLGGGGVIINQNNVFEVGVDEQVRRQVAILAPQIMKLAVDAVRSERRQGGGFSQEFS